MKAHIIIILTWVIFSCVLSGIVASAFNMPSLWGNSNNILEYLLPLPFSWGMLHYPSLALFGFLLFKARLAKPQWLSTLRHLSVGIFFASLCIAILSKELRHFPLLMYFSVDAVTALIFSFFTQSDDNLIQKIQPAHSLLLLFAPTVLAILFLYTSQFFKSRYNFAMSDIIEINAEHDVVRFWLYLNKSKSELKQECIHLEEYAEKRKNAYLRSNGTRHRQILLFEDKEKLVSGNENNAWISYEWWPDGRKNCAIVKF